MKNEKEEIEIQIREMQEKDFFKKKKCIQALFIFFTPLTVFFIFFFILTDFVFVLLRKCLVLFSFR